MKETTALDRVLKGKNKIEKRQVAFYLSKKLYADFKAHCKKLKVTESHIIEALIEDFLKSY